MIGSPDKSLKINYVKLQKTKSHKMLCLVTKLATTHTPWMCVVTILRQVFSGYFASTVIDLPALWALNCGAYWHWMVAMPEVNSPGLVTHTS